MIGGQRQWLQYQLAEPTARSDCLPVLASAAHRWPAVIPSGRFGRSGRWRGRRSRRRRCPVAADAVASPGDCRRSRALGSAGDELGTRSFMKSVAGTFRKHIQVGRRAPSGFGTADRCPDCGEPVSDSRTSCTISWWPPARADRARFWAAFPSALSLALSATVAYCFLASSSSLWAS